MTTSQEHWERVYAEKDPAEVSWYEPSPTRSLELIDGLDVDRAAPVIDVGGGASRLALELLERGFEDVTVADISAAAHDRAKADLGGAADRVHWVVADVRSHDFGRTYALWHDRAVFHFMVAPEDRAAYIENVRRSIAPGGHALVATFGPEGPNMCSGLPVNRYSADELAAVFGKGFAPASDRLTEHRTPSGKSQQFLYAVLQRTGDTFGDGS